MDIEFCRQYDMLPRSGLVLCAVSGGKDSMYLLERLRALAPETGFTLHCAHFDHRLRGAESDRDRAFVRDWCAACDIPCHIGAGDVAAYASGQGLGTEEAARVLRYAFLEETADKIGASRIATAHTADDNAETLLMNLARGSGLKGLSGIPPVRGRLIRPLLTTTAAEILLWLKENGVPHVEDATNALEDALRNRVRHRIIPELRVLNAGFDKNLIRCQRLLREDEAYFDALAADFLEQNAAPGGVSAADFAALPAPVSVRVLARLVPAGLSEAHIAAVRRIAAGNDPHARADLPGLRAQRDYARLLFQTETPAELTPRRILPGTVTVLPEAELELSCEFINKCEEIHNSFNNFCFQSGSICGNIFVKSRSDGEKIRLAGRNCTKTLKKLFSEAKLNGEGKALVPVIYDDQGPIAVYGFGIAERCVPQPGDSVLRLTIRKTDTG
jgi:tRNA(Ile)-lysidine synthase